MKKSKLEALIKSINPRAVIKDSGDYLMTNCPLAPWTHASGRDGKPSCSFKSTKESSFFVCFTCNTSGNLHKLIDFLEQYKGQSLPNLRDYVLTHEHVECDAFEDSVLLEEEVIEVLDYNFYKSLFESCKDYTEASSYLTARGVSLGVAERVGLQYDPEERRILAPVFDEDKNFYGFTSRKVTQDSRSKTLDYAGLPKTNLYLGLQFYKPGKPIFLVEGLFDWLNIIQSGVMKYATPIASLGVGMSNNKVTKLANLGEKVFLCFDNDSAGQEAINKENGLYDRLSSVVPVEVVSYPENLLEPEQFNRDHIFDIFNKKSNQQKVTIW